MRLSGFTALLAIFAVVCTIFAGVVTASEWSSGKTKNLDTDLQIVAVAAGMAVAMLLLTRLLSVREAREPVPAAVDPGAPSPVFGLLCGSIGVFMIGFAIFRISTAALPPDGYMAIPAGLIFVFGGVLIALPTGRVRARRVFAALLVTAFAVCFDWIAFVPGERHFSGGISIGAGAFGFSPGALAGRIIFGIPAVLMTVAALVMWVRMK
jgi:hypothetical protein